MATVMRQLSVAGEVASRHCINCSPVATLARFEMVLRRVRIASEVDGGMEARATGKGEMDSKKKPESSFNEVVRLTYLRKQ